MSRRTDQDWYPEQGDALAGTLVDAMLVEGTKYGDVKLAVIQEAETDIKWGVWLTPKVLKSLFAVHRPAPGSLIFLEYVGKRTGRKGGEYKHYLMAVDQEVEDTTSPWLDAFRAAQVEHLAAAEVST